MGGSFNPPHEGHLLASRLALRRLKLDRLWWLVTPGNPLKPIDGLPPLARAHPRRAGYRARSAHRADRVRGRDRRTLHFDSTVWLLRRAPTVRFVWIMGRQSAAVSLVAPLARRWLQLLPIAVVDRPGSTLRALNSQAGGALSPFRVPERGSGGISPEGHRQRLFFCMGRARASLRRRFAAFGDTKAPKAEPIEADQRFLLLLSNSQLKRRRREVMFSAGVGSPTSSGGYQR